MEILIFGFGDKENYGIDVLDIREIMSVRAVYPIPGGSSNVHGYMDVRGQAIPILNAAGAMGLVGDEKPETAIILDLPDPMAIAVKTINRIIKIKGLLGDHLQMSGESQAIKGVINHDMGLIQILDHEALIAMAIS